MNFRKLVACILSCAVMGVALPCAPYVNVTMISASDEAEYTEVTYGALTYKNYGDHIEISDCDSSAIEVEIPEEIDGVPVTAIGEYAFSGDYYPLSALTSITLPNSITEIGDWAFANCYSLSSIKISDSVTSIGDSTFSHCRNLTSITIPDSVTSIGENAFYNCESLINIDLSEKLTSIGSEAFYNCISLKSITIPKGLTTINYGTFNGCSSLTSITIPDSITSIEYLAFSGCESLKSIYILNPTCKIPIDYGNTYLPKSTINNGNSDGFYYFTGIIYGYANSSVQYYAKECGYTFVALNDASTESGDANGNGIVEIADAVFIMQGIADPANRDFALSESGMITANCKNPNSSGIDSEDALAIQMYMAELIPSLPAE